MMLFSFLLFFILDWSYSQTVSDLCDKKQFLPFTHQTNRSVNYNKTTDLSDRFMREGWYGLQDFIIPSIQPASRHCGTKYPIFLERAPSNNRIVENVKACIRDCITKMDIKAVKCSDRLTVYELVRPLNNGAAYCLDGIDSGQLEFHTTVTIDTNLRTVPNSNYNKKEFIFDCSFPNPNRDSLVYKATWFVTYVNDTIMVYESNYTDYNDVNKIRSLTDTRLRESNITTVGFQLHCSIIAAVDTKRSPSLPSTSKKKFIGMIVESSVINIQEGEKATIRIRPTVPIGCGEPEGCTLTVTADIPQGDEKKCEPTPTANGVCGIAIKTSEWNKKWTPSMWYWDWHAHWYWSLFQLEITSTVTLNYAQTTTKKKVFLRTDESYFNQPIWEKYKLEPVTINIDKDTSLIEGKTCKIHNDPYLEDFNEEWSFRSFQMEGTFYLLQMENVEVQVQITDCTGRRTGYCVCGVVVRVGRTAFMINRCNLEYWYIDYIFCDDGADILDVRKKHETEFEMYLPSDTKIQITQKEKSHYHWLSIHIFPSVRDIGKTSGLCGELTADPPTVEYNDAYFNSFRVNTEVTLFDPGNWRSLPEWTTNNTVRFQHCRCDERVVGEIDTSLNCSPVPGATTCSSETDYTLFHKKRCINPLRKKRSLPRGLKPPVGLHYRRLRRDVSWKNGWTRNSASEYCSGLFNNSMVIKRCEGIRGINIEEAIETCISDIQLSGTDVFALSSISSVGAQCLREATMNGTLREVKVNNNKTILEMVEEVACPGECSDQGLCEDGKCICNTGYIGSDCSISVNTPPLAHNLEADGHCDLSVDDCTEVAVFGGRFVDHDKTKCQLLPFNIKNNQVTVSKEREIITAVFESIGEVTCKLPSRKRRRRSVDVPVIDETVIGYKVSVSNNGQNYSQQLHFIIYNTECINCSIDNSDQMICIPSLDHCIMENRCYRNGSMYNSGDREFVCRADSSGKAWFTVINGTEVVTEEPFTTEMTTMTSTMGDVTEHSTITEMVDTTLGDVTKNQTAKEVTGTTMDTVTEDPTKEMVDTTLGDVTKNQTTKEVTGTTMDTVTDDPTKEVTGTTMDTVTEDSTKEVTGTTMDTVTEDPTKEEQIDYVVIGISTVVAVVFIIVCIIIFCVAYKKTRTPSTRVNTFTPTTNPNYDLRHDNPYDNNTRFSR